MNIRENVSKRAFIVPLASAAVVVALSLAFRPEPAPVAESTAFSAEPVFDPAHPMSIAPPAKEFSFDREMILNDVEGRVAQDFKIPDGLRDRVGFWFDIYTKYGSNHRVIHHSVYPWIVFKVVDVSPIINSDTPRVRWLRNVKADKFVEAETDVIRKALRHLARDGRPEGDEENLVAEALRPLGGDLRRQAARALKEVRVQTGQRDFFAEGMKISRLHLEHMEEIFRAHRLPVELTRLPFVESSFKDHATSKVGASGIWQFTESTGRLFLRVDNVIDERRSPLKSTDGAARLLKENYVNLRKSWPLAITAWNHGPNGIRKAAKAAGSRDLSVIISKYRSKSFDFASSNFYSEFLAALHAERYGHEAFGPLTDEIGPAPTVYSLPRQTRLNDLIRLSGLSREEFLRLNPELKSGARHNIVLPKGFKLRLAEDTKQELEKRFSPKARVASTGT